MKSKNRSIKKRIKRRIELNNKLNMGVRDKLRRSGNPSPHIPVDLVSRNSIRQGIKEFRLSFGLDEENIDFITKIPTSVIISYKESSDERKRNLLAVLDFFSEYLSDNFEIILVEQDNKSNVNWLGDIDNCKYIKHVFIKNTAIFNKGHGFNVGAMHANGKNLIFNDSDVLVSYKTYQISINLLESFDVVNPYKYIYWLDELKTIDFISKRYKLNLLLNYHLFAPTVITGGIFLIKKETFLRIKGFDENSFGWGYQDYIFDEKLKKLGLSIGVNESKALHLNHEGFSKPGVNNKMSNDKYFSYSERNLGIYESYKKMTEKDVLNKIDNTLTFGKGKIRILKVTPPPKLISVVMSYYNRRKHLINTLYSMTKSIYKNFEVIVVDDASDDNHRIEDLEEKFKFLTVHRIEKKDKNHTNPCVPTNIALGYASGDIIIIQNPESFHHGDVFNHVINNISKNKYLAYTTLNKEISDELKTINWSINYEKQINKIIKIDKNDNSSKNEWYCHERFRPMALNFCTAIIREDLIELNGFDERYAYGTERDDVEFLDRIKRKGMEIRFVDNILVIHQSHDKLFNENIDEFNRLKVINRRLYKRTTATETIIEVNPNKIILNKQKMII